MAEDMILQQILMDTYQVTRSGWKISGLFSQNEIRREVKTEVLNEDLQRNSDDYQTTDLNYNSLLPMPYYDDLPQHNIQPKVELDILRPSVLDEEADWDLRSFDDIENIDCEIFSELSDLVTTEECIQVKTEDVKEPKPELPAITSKPSVINVARNINHPVSESPTTLMPTASTDVTVHFLDHNYADHNYAAPIVPKTPAMHPAIDNNAYPAIIYEQRRDVGDEMDVGMSKTTKYVERRKKNNLASRRSRETRKRKYVEMQEQVFELERKNAELRNRVSRMEWLSGTMKRSLFGKKKKTDDVVGGLYNNMS